MHTIYLVALGCEKNNVDAEHILAIVREEGFEITLDALEADIIIINTCAFIEDAKKESIDAIFDHSLYKKYGRCKRLIVSGCMSERYKETFLDMFVEVDAAIGIHDLKQILLAIKEDGFYSASGESEYREYALRVPTGSLHSAYIRISDGCHANCSFCAIPMIRGKHRSRSIEAIIAEVEHYAKNGVKEVNLIAHETTFYGFDLYKDFLLPELLQKISNVDGIRWIRVLYQNPVLLIGKSPESKIFSNKLIKAFFDTPKVVPYFDLPLQHVDSSILADMNRLGDFDSNAALISKIRSYNDDAVIRSSFIVGFPGETSDTFKGLVRFIKETKIDRVGVFTYSEEEGTKSLLIKKRKADNEKKIIRRERLMNAAIAVSEKRLSRFLGRDIDVLIERFDTESNQFTGRSMYDAPEVDGYVYLDCISNKQINIGDIVSVSITHNSEHDLFGKLSS